MDKVIKITRVGQDFEQLELVAPFGFKGGSSSVLWNTAAMMGSEDNFGVGLGTEGILWSDERVFFNASNLTGSAMMFLMTAFALREANGKSFGNPDELLDQIFDATYEYGCAVTGYNDLRQTFALNSLVPFDFAAWQLYFKERKLSVFDDIIPPSAAPSLKARHQKLACIPLISYGVQEEEIVRLAKEGTPLFKIKIGNEYDWDIQRLTQIHRLIGDIENEHTDSGRVLYYLDANGRYENLDKLMKLVAHAEKIGAADRIVLLEEPFAEGSDIDVSQVPLCVAADESAHSDADVDALAKLGYRAVALKPIAKTMSMTFRMLNAARRHNMAAFCADLTVNPIMVDWNKNIAARLDAIPGMKIGAFESNGAQNYKDWKEMESRHPSAGSGGSWLYPDGGIFTVRDDFYAESGGIFEDSGYYKQLFGL